MDLDLCPRTTRLWAMRGHPLTVVTPGDNVKRTVFGAISHLGKFYYSIRAKKNSKEFLAFIKGLFSRVICEGQKVLMIMDSYSIHRAKKVEEFVESLDGQLRIAFLPKYCPQDNPQESVWSLVHRRALHNCFHKTIEERIQWTRRFLAQIQHQDLSHIVS